MATLNSFEELECWKACRELRLYVMDLSKKFPDHEKFDLTSNMKRAARSTTRNIAEGFGRHHDKENLRFCRISRGSLTEIIDDFLIAREENYITEEEYNKGREITHKAISILNGYIRYLNKKIN